MNISGRELTAISCLSACEYSAPPHDKEVSVETLATFHESPQTELTLARRVSYHPRDPVCVLAAHMERESDDQIPGKALAAKLFSADRTAGVPLPRIIDSQHRLVFWHDT
jgi:hypothetical protein